jgi:hypothetical protein
MHRTRDQPLIVQCRLEEGSGASSKVRLRIGFDDQCKSLTELSGDPSLHGLPVALLRWPLKRCGMGPL